MQLLERVPPDLETITLNIEKLQLVLKGEHSTLEGKDNKARVKDFFEVGRGRKEGRGVRRCAVQGAHL